MADSTAGDAAGPGCAAGGLEAADWPRGGTAADGAGGSGAGGGVTFEVRDGEAPGGGNHEADLEHDIEPGSEAGGGVVLAARRRARGSGRRVSRLTVRLSAAEHGEVAAAASAAGVTAAGFTAGAVLAAARGEAAPGGGSPVRVVLGELMAARRQLRGYAVNVNQAAKVLNAGGEAPEWLEAAIEACEGAVARVDEATAAVMRGLK